MKKTKSEVAVTYSVKDWDKAPVSLEKIADLIFDWKLYPRSQIDHEVVAKYAKALQAGANFPYVKIGVLNGRKIIVDGVHRIKSRELLKIDYIECKVLPFPSQAELFAEAVICNSSHGKGFCEPEIRENVKRLKKYNFQTSDIVAICHVPTSEITNRNLKPILSIRSPSGKNIPCKEIKPGEKGVYGLICVKNALLIVCSWAEAQKIPDEPPFRELVSRAREALTKVRFNND